MIRAGAIVLLSGNFAHQVRPLCACFLECAEKLPNTLWRHALSFGRGFLSFFRGRGGGGTLPRFEQLSRGRSERGIRAGRRHRSEALWLRRVVARCRRRKEKWGRRERLASWVLGGCYSGFHRRVLRFGRVRWTWEYSLLHANVLEAWTLFRTALYHVLTRAAAVTGHRLARIFKIYF